MVAIGTTILKMKANRLIPSYERLILLTLIVGLSCTLTVSWEVEIEPTPDSAAPAQESSNYQTVGEEAPNDGFEATSSSSDAGSYPQQEIIIETHVSNNGNDDEVSYVDADGHHAPAPNSPTQQHNVTIVHDDDKNHGEHQDFIIVDNVEAPVDTDNEGSHIMVIVDGEYDYEGSSGENGNDVVIVMEPPPESGPPPASGSDTDRGARSLDVGILESNVTETSSRAQTSTGVPPNRSTRSSDTDPNNSVPGSSAFSAGSSTVASSVPNPGSSMNPLNVSTGPMPASTSESATTQSSRFTQTVSKLVSAGSATEPSTSTTMEPTSSTTSSTSSSSETTVMTTLSTGLNDTTASGSGESFSSTSDTTFRLPIDLSTTSVPTTTTSSTSSTTSSSTTTILSTTTVSTTTAETSSVHAEPSTTSSEPPTTSSERPTTSSEPPTTSSERPTTSSERPTTSSERPTTSSERPTTTSKPPTTSSEPTTLSKELEAVTTSLKGFSETSKALSTSTSSGAPTPASTTKRKRRRTTTLIPTRPITSSKPSRRPRTTTSKRPRIRKSTTRRSRTSPYSTRKPKKVSTPKSTNLLTTPLPGEIIQAAPANGQPSTALESTVPPCNCKCHQTIIINNNHYNYYYGAPGQSQYDHKPPTHDYTAEEVDRDPAIYPSLLPGVGTAYSKDVHKVLPPTSNAVVFSTKKLKTPKRLSPKVRFAHTGQGTQRRRVQLLRTKNLSQASGAGGIKVLRKVKKPNGQQELVQTLRKRRQTVFRVKKVIGPKAASQQTSWKVIPKWKIDELNKKGVQITYGQIEQRRGIPRRSGRMGKSSKAEARGGRSGPVETFSPTLEQPRRMLRYVAPPSQRSTGTGKRLQKRKQLWKEYQLKELQLGLKNRIKKRSHMGPQVVHLKRSKVSDSHVHESH